VQHQSTLKAEKGDRSQATLGSGKPLPTTDPIRFKPDSDKGPKVDSADLGKPPVELQPASKDLEKFLEKIRQGQKPK